LCVFVFYSLLFVLSIQDDMDMNMGDMGGMGGMDDMDGMFDEF
jgi:hypothetical protein